MKKVINIFILFGIFIIMTGCNDEQKAVSLYNTRNSPIIYNSVLYFYSEDTTIPYENQSSKGITLKYPRGFLNNIEKKKLYYDVTDANQSILVSNENNLLGNYIQQEKIEETERTNKLLETYDDFLIEKQTITCDQYGSEEVEDANSVSTEPLEKSVVEKLESQYGAVTYNLEDFENIEELFFIKAGCVNESEFLNKYTENGYFAVGDFDDTEIPELFIGIIIKKDGAYYYGNVNNKISDELAEELGI